MFEEPYLFISYSRHDIVAIKLMRGYLEESGFSCFFDKTDIGFETFEERIKAEIGKSNCFIACITGESWRNDGFVKVEWNYAAELKESPSNTMAIVPTIMDAEVRKEVEGEQSIFRKYNSFYLWEGELKDLVLKLKRHFSIPVIELINKTGNNFLYKVTVGDKTHKLRVKYSWGIYEQAYFEDSTVKRFSRFNFSKYESMLQVIPPALKSPLIIRLSFKKAGQIKRIQFEYQKKEIYSADLKK